MKNKKAYIGYIGFGLVLIAIPFLQKAGFIASAAVITIGTVIFYSIAGVGLNILLGYSGLISLGTAGFMGLAAYLSGYLTHTLSLPFELAFIIAVGVPVLLSILIGLISLRLSGYHLAIATLAVSEILRHIFVELEFLTGGFSGLPASYPKLIGFFQLDRSGTFIFMSIILVFVLIFTHNIAKSRTGRALLAMRGSDSAARAMGINVFKYKLIAFGLATFFAATAGVLYMHFIRYAYPSDWMMMLSLQILALIVIGGMRTIIGPVVGAFVVFGFPDLVLKRLPLIGDINGLAYIFAGIVIIAVLIFYPQGLVFMGKDIARFVKIKLSKGGSSDE